MSSLSDRPNQQVEATRGTGSQPSPQNRRFPGVALVLQGGGARAAYQVGVLKALSEILEHPAENPFPVISGTSAGAINAAVLASNASHFADAVRILEDIWGTLKPSQVYRTDLPGVAAC
ncbi:MAG: patatin-like phospholipase family protein, partial [Betaproteobacteria bacterium]